VKRIEAQMKAYVEAIKIGSPSIKYDVDVSNRVLNIFKHESVMKCLIERMQQDVYFRNMQEHFLFITLKEFNENTIYQNRRSAKSVNLSLL